MINLNRFIYPTREVPFEGNYSIITIYYLDKNYYNNLEETVALFPEESFFLNNIPQTTAYMNVKIVEDNLGLDHSNIENGIGLVSGVSFSSDSLVFVPDE